MNKDWHLANPMPKNPTLDQRVEWHLAHTQNCDCRKPSGKILDELIKRGYVSPDATRSTDRSRQLPGDR